MRACITQKNGYVVSVHMVKRGEDFKAWHDVFNFGDRQSDAIEVRDRINKGNLCSRYADDKYVSTENYLQTAIRAYNPEHRRRLAKNSHGHIFIATCKD